MIKSDLNLTKHVNDSYTFNILIYAYVKQNIKKKLKLIKKRFKKIFTCSRLNKLRT